MQLLEKVADLDDELMMKYLEGEELTEEEIKAALRQRDLNVEIVPVLCGSSYKNKGVQLLLDAVVDYLPSPLDVPAIQGTASGRHGASRESGDDQPFAALAFKIMTDPYVGKLTFFRVYSGTLSSGSYVLNSTKGKRERIGRILQMHANHREEINTLYAGDIAAAVGLKDTTTGDTLCDEKQPIILESMVFPDPVISVAIEPKTKADQDKMATALSDCRKRIPPSVPIRRGDGTDHHLRDGRAAPGGHRRPAEAGVQSGGQRRAAPGGLQGDLPQAGQGGREVHPADRGTRSVRSRVDRIRTAAEGAGFEFENKIVGGVVPKEYIPAVQAGIEEAMQNGVLAGYPMVDMKATIFDGSYHDVDSSEMAFKIAGSIAFKAAKEKCDPVLLEPIMKVEVTVPEEYMGDIIGDINSRRGRVEGMDSRSGSQVIRAFVPLAEMFGYATNLRSRTQGRGTYIMQFDHYEEVPKNIADEIISNASGE